MTLPRPTGRKERVDPKPEELGPSNWGATDRSSCKWHKVPGNGAHNGNDRTPGRAKQRSACAAWNATQVGSSLEYLRLRPSDHSPRVNRRKTGIFCGSPSLCTVAGRKPFFTLCEDSTTLTRPAQQFPPRLPFTHHRPVCGLVGQAPGFLPPLQPSSENQEQPPRFSGAPYR